MAKVEIGRFRNQARHYGLHKQYLAGDEPMIIRRKVGDPTDVVHSSSRKLKRQRELLSEASRHYATLTPSQKAITRHQIAEVDHIKDGRKSDTKLLMGRQLFISRDMASLKLTGKLTQLPRELCIILADTNLIPLPGTLWLRYLENGDWLNASKEELATGSWLFSQVPRGKEAYRVYGESGGYYDPQLPEHQNMTEAAIRAYHYHCLYVGEPVPTFSWKGVIIRSSVPFTAPFSARNCHIITWISTELYDGILTIGVKDYPDTTVPEEWIASLDYPITPAVPDLRYFETNLYDCRLQQGKKYWLTHELLTNQTNYISAHGYITFSVPFPEP